YLLKNKYVEFAQKSFAVALIFVTLASLAQPLIGHQHAHVVRDYQPGKLAAFEGLYESTENAPLYVFGYTNPETKKTYGIAIPGMLSLLTWGELNHEVAGLDKIPPEEWPNVGLVFQTYHGMVAIGMFLIGLTLFSLFLLWRNKLFEQKWLMKVFVISVILPVLANQLGWISAEVGRQPWIVQGLLKTSEAVSPSVSGGMVLSSLIMFLIMYGLLFWVWVYVLDKEIKHGPAEFFKEGEGSSVYRKRENKVFLGKK
ncbi:MAG: cytochrome ubiquinol oxidase subunit I, partial [Bacteroidetes bacterium]|nr:cytochrome ubiquinol oxidase subunit I [Bacteroidota bacterium]